MKHLFLFCMALLLVMPALSAQEGSTTEQASAQEAALPTPQNAASEAGAPPTQAGSDAAGSTATAEEAGTDPIQEELVFAEDLLPAEEPLTVPAAPFDSADITLFAEDKAFTLLSEILPSPAATAKPAERKSISLASEEILAREDVDKFRRQYLSPKWAAALKGYLENAMEYRLYVRKAVQDEGLPEVLEYLPVVESNYKTNAKSRSGAIGMWQFMANSVYPFLTLNDYVDERLDPWKSTDAALKKLQDNYNYFGDWLLAIAAYNCGMGALNRIITKAGGQKDFWYLADNHLLPEQTANYVPKLLAIADLAINSEYYGIDLPSHEEEFEILENEKNGNFDYITVKQAYSLNQLALEMRMDTARLRQLNPSYVLGMTHPSKSSEIRLPLGMEQSARDALAKIEPLEFPIKYTVTAGDSLWSISRRYKVTVQELCELNDIKENAILKIGKILYIPVK